MRKGTQLAMRAAQQLRETAYHEAGHAVAAVVTGIGLREKGVTIRPIDGMLGYTYLRQPRKTTDGTLEYVGVLLCGAAAVGILKGVDLQTVQELYGAGTDLEYAAAALRDITTDTEATYKLRRLLYEGSLDLLRENWTAVEAIAGMLIEHGALTGKQAKDIVNRMHMVTQEEK